MSFTRKIYPDLTYQARYSLVGLGNDVNDTFINVTSHFPAISPGLTNADEKEQWESFPKKSFL